MVKPFSPDVEFALEDTAARYGVPASRLRAFVNIESGGRPNVRTGSYNGLLQLSNQEFAKHGGGNIWNPADNLRAGAIKLKAEAEQYKRQYGREPTDADLYLVHQQGWGGASAHWSNPDQPAWQSMYSTAEGRQKGPGWARQAIWGNVPSDLKRQYGSVDNITSRQFTDLWANKVAHFGGDSGATAPTAEASAMPNQSIYKYGGDANTKGPRAGSERGPIDPQLMNETAKLNIGSQRSKLIAAMLDKMAYGGELPKSNLEGLSKVVAAIGGGYAASKQDSADLKKREILTQLLGGQDMTALEQYGLASGDPDLEKAVFAAGVGRRNDLDAKSLQINELIRQGVPADVAAKIASGAFKAMPDGSFMDYTNGTRISPDGRAIQVIPSDQYQQPGAQGAPQGAPQGAAPSQTQPGAPDVLQGVAGSDVSVGGPVPPAPPMNMDEGRPAIAQGVIDPRQGDMAYPKEQSAKAQEEMAALARTESSLNALVESIDPRMLTAGGQTKNVIQNFADWIGIPSNISDPAQEQMQGTVVKQLFNEYRKYVTGAAAAQQELAALEQTFVNTNMTQPQFFAAAETLRTLGRRNYAINRALVQQGLQPGVGDYGAKFDELSKAGNGFDLDLEGVPARSKEQLERSLARWKTKDAEAAAAKKAKKAPAAAVAPAESDVPEPAAVQHLKDQDTPEMRAYFDQKFGAGAAARVLGGM